MVPQKIMYVDDESLIGKLVQGEIGCSLLAEPIAMRFANENMLQIWEGIDLNIDLHFGYLKDKKSDAVFLEIGSIVDRIWNADGISIVKVAMEYTRNKENTDTPCSIDVRPM